MRKLNDVYYTCIIEHHIVLVRFYDSTNNQTFQWIGKYVVLFIFQKVGKDSRVAINHSVATSTTPVLPTLSTGLPTLLLISDNFIHKPHTSTQIMWNFLISSKRVNDSYAE